MGFIYLFIAVSDLVVHLSHLSLVQALLLHRHQLPQDRAGADHADEPPQEELGGRAHPQVSWRDAITVNDLLSFTHLTNFCSPGTTSSTAT